MKIYARTPTIYGKIYLIDKNYLHTSQSPGYLCKYRPLFHSFSFMFMRSSTPVAAITTSAKVRQFTMPIAPWVNQSGSTTPVRLLMA